MDRFIGAVQQLTKQFKKNLKSNMDRFIELVDNLFTDLKNNLKSNMDRFIVIQRAKCSVCTKFKIQYG